MIQPSAVRLPLLCPPAVLVGRERSPGTAASSDTADPAATRSPPVLSQTWIEGWLFYFLQQPWLFYLNFCSSVSTCMPDVLLIFQKKKHFKGARLFFLGLSGYRYFVFSSLRPALLKYFYRQGCYKKQLFQRQLSSNCLRRLFSLGLGHPQQQQISPNYNIRQ